MTGLSSGCVVALCEWQDAICAELQLSANDVELASQLAASGRATIEQLPGGVRIQAKSWVGLIRFDHFYLRIIPKLADGNENLVQMLALAGGLDAAWRFPANSNVFVEETRDILDLLARLLVLECSRIINLGVLQDYRECEEDLPVVRGRIIVERQWRRRYGQFDRIECRHDEHDANVDENRLIVSALSLCTTQVRDRTILASVMSMQEQFAALGDPFTAPDLQQVRERMSYHRRNSYYKDAHQLCWLILDGMGVTDLLTGGAVKSRAFMIDMNAVFERFVLKLLEFVASSDGVVRYQFKDRSVLWNATDREPYGSVIPDCLIKSSTGSVVVDAKYKPGGRIDNADIYQCFLYAQAFGTGLHSQRSALMFPSLYGKVDETIIEIRAASAAKLHLIGVPVAQALKELIASRRGPITAKLADMLGIVNGQYN